MAPIYSVFPFHACKCANLAPTIYFLGMFAKLQKASISFIVSVHLFVCTEQLGSKQTDVREN
jgi:hypothetical protein